MHRPSPEIPIDETLGALTDLVRAGKVRYVGCSTHPAWMVMEALAVSERDRLVRYVSEQPPYNLLDRRIENELVPLAQKHQLAILPWAPLAQGVLAGRYSSADAPPADSRAAVQPDSIYSRRVTARGDRGGPQVLGAGARPRAHARPARAALVQGPARRHRARSSGPRTLEQIQDLLPVLGLALTDEQRAACDAINPPGTALVNFHNTAGWMKTCDLVRPEACGLRPAADPRVTAEAQAASRRPQAAGRSDLPQLLDTSPARTRPTAIISTPLTTSTAGAEKTLAR